MRTDTIVGRIVAIAILWIGAAGANANVLTYSVSGILDTSFDTLQGGDAFTMTYSVDTSVPLFGQASFAFANSVTSAEIHVGAFSAFAAQGTLLQVSAPSHDQYEVQGTNAVGSSQIGGLDISYFALEMHDLTGTAIADARTVLADPSVAQFSETAFWVIFGNGLGFVHGTIDRIVAVPEPGTLMLLTLGLASLLRLRGRRAAIQ